MEWTVIPLASSIRAMRIRLNPIRSQHGVHRGAKQAGLFDGLVLIEQGHRFHGPGGVHLEDRT